MEQESGAVIRYVGAIFRSKTPVMLIICLTLVVAIIYAAFTPRKYGSSMEFLVQNARATPVISGDRSNPATAAAMDSEAMESQINSEVQLLQSNDLLEGLAAYHNTLKGLKPSVEGSLPMVHDIMAVQRDLEITPIRKTNLVEVSYKDADPFIAQKMLQRLTSAFLDKHADLRHSEGTYRFFDTQSEQSEEHLRAAEKALVDFQSANNVVSLSQQKSSALEDYNRVTQQIGESRATLNDDKSRLASLNSQVNATSGRTITQVRSSSDSYSADQLSTMLATLENKRTELLTRLQPGEPLVREVEQQISSTQAAIHRARDQNNVETVSDNNPIRQTLEQDSRKTQADALGQSARLSSLQEQATAEKTLLTNYEKISLQEDALERNVQELRQNHEIYSQKRDEAKIDDELDHSKIVDVVIAQKPTMSMLPVQPHRMTTLVMGCLAACFFALAFVFVKDALRDTAQTPAELEAMIGCPVLATIPETRSIQPPELAMLPSSTARIHGLETLSQI